MVNDENSSKIKCFVFEELPELVEFHASIAYILESIIFHCISWGPKIVGIVGDHGRDIISAVCTSFAKHYFINCVGGDLMLLVKSIVDGQKLSCGEKIYKFNMQKLFEYQKLGWGHKSGMTNTNYFKNLDKRLISLKAALSNGDENSSLFFDSLVNLHSNLKTNFKIENHLRDDFQETIKLIRNWHDGKGHLRSLLKSMVKFDKMLDNGVPLRFSHLSMYRSELTGKSNKSKKHETIKTNLKLSGHEIIEIGYNFVRSDEGRKRILCHCTENCKKEEHYNQRLFCDQCPGKVFIGEAKLDKHLKLHFKNEYIEEREHVSSNLIIII